MNEEKTQGEYKWRINALEKELLKQSMSALQIEIKGMWKEYTESNKAFKNTADSFYSWMSNHIKIVIRGLSTNDIFEPEKNHDTP
jgi:hypothetical protein